VRLVTFQQQWALAVIGSSGGCVEVGWLVEVLLAHERLMINFVVCCMAWWWASADDVHTFVTHSEGGCAQPYPCIDYKTLADFSEAWPAQPPLLYL
jgi:hypothetical protein